MHICDLDAFMDGILDGLRAVRIFLNLHRLSYLYLLEQFLVDDNADPGMDNRTRSRCACATGYHRGYAKKNKSPDMAHVVISIASMSFAPEGSCSSFELHESFDHSQSETSTEIRREVHRRTALG